MADKENEYRGMFLNRRCCGGWWGYQQNFLQFFQTLFNQPLQNQPTNKPTGGEANDIL